MASIHSSKYTEETKKRMFQYRAIDENGCWLWTGCLDTMGYGQISFENIMWPVHRLSLKLFKPDEFKEFLNVNHRNICTSKRCFNPEHLYAGTQQENVEDFLATGKHGQLIKTHCPRGHRYTPENTYVNPKNNKRVCRICKNNSTNISKLLRSF